MLVPPQAARQDGVFTRQQARESGLSSWVVSRRLAEGVWVPVLGDSYALAGVAVTARARIRAAQLLTRATVSHASAAELHRLDIGYDGSLHVITDRRIHVDVPGITDHRLRLDDDEHAEIDGIAVTTRHRTLLDVLSWAPRHDAERILFKAIQQRWLSHGDLHAAVVRRRHRAGNAQLRELADLTGTGAHSVAERRLHDILATVDGLRWRANAPLSIDGRTFVVDVLLTDAPVVIEVDGRRYHSDAAVFQRDRRRQNALVTAGYVVLRFTWIDLVQRQHEVRTAILAASR